MSSFTSVGEGGVKAALPIKKGECMDSRIKKNPRYSRFMYFDEPVIFNVYFKDRDYDLVQIHDINPIGKEYPDPIGFVGQFEWKSNTLTPLDGDSYTAQMPIYGFEEFTSDDGLKCIDILTDRW